MEDFNSESDSDYTSYWRDWVSRGFLLEREHYSVTFGTLLRFLLLINPTIISFLYHSIFS